MNVTDNFFLLFALPVSLPVDLTLLNAHYQRLQRQYHPDNAGLADEREKAGLLQQSATINEAYQTLKDPLRAAEYVLALQGFDVASEQNIIHDSHFLQQQFELREQLDEIEQLPVEAQKLSQLADFNQYVAKQKQQSQQQLLTAIHQQAWTTALLHVYRLRFLLRIQQQIDQIEEQLF